MEGDSRNDSIRLLVHSVQVSVGGNEQIAYSNGGGYREMKEKR